MIPIYSMCTPSYWSSWLCVSSSLVIRSILLHPQIHLVQNSDPILSASIKSKPRFRGFDDEHHKILVQNFCGYSQNFSLHQWHLSSWHFCRQDTKKNHICCNSRLMEVSDQVPTLQIGGWGKGGRGRGGSVAMRHGCPSLILLAAKVFGCTLEL